MPKRAQILNYIAGEWRAADVSGQVLDVINPATADALASVPVSTSRDVDAAVQAASQAFREWRAIPPAERVQFLFRLKTLLDNDIDRLARTITLECGKTLAEARAELKRAVENVETACGMPLLMQGHVSENIAAGIDELMIRQPVGVCAIVTPFNFPAMIAFWFLPYAIACGNTCIVKPSEKVPCVMQEVLRLIEQAGVPKGVVNLINGDASTVDALIAHPHVAAVSFVGSTPVARSVYARAAASGKRAQCQGGAKNAIVVLPDAAGMDSAQVIAESAFGCAGQRCLAASIAITVGAARDAFTESISHVARTRVTGDGLEAGVEMGPVITAESKARVYGLIERGHLAGARLVVDGRTPRVTGSAAGFFVGPTVLDQVHPSSELAQTEVFGPVLSLMHVDSVDEAIATINSGRYGNMASLFTRSGDAARKFRTEVEAGNIGINVGIAAPMSFFPFSGWKESFFGDLHAQGRDAVQFFTQEKVIVEKWVTHKSRMF